MKAKQLIAVSDMPFSEWIKRKEALAFFDLQKDEKDAQRRMLALSRQIMTFTESETFQLFLQAIDVKKFSVLSIQEWLDKKKQTEKAVIM